MAFVGSVNNVFTAADSVAGLFAAIKTALLAAGWVIQGSSNGTSTFSNASSVDNTGNFAANGSWLRIREPSGAGGREYVFYRGSATTALIKYSRSVGFGTGGGLTAAPTTGVSGDGVVWLGTQVGFSASATGTNTYDQAATGAAQCATISGVSDGFVSCVASDTATNGVYGWWAFSCSRGTGTLGCAAYTDAVAVGSCPVTDNDPSYRQFTTSSGWYGWDVSTSLRCHFWQAYPAVWSSPTTAQYRTEAPGFSYWSATNGALTAIGQIWPPLNTTSGLNPYNDKPQLIPCFISVINLVGSPPKGFTSNVLYALGPFNNTDTLDLTAPTARILVSGFTLGGSLSTWLTFPWVQNTLPLV